MVAILGFPHPSSSIPLKTFRISRKILILRNPQEYSLGYLLKGNLWLLISWHLLTTTTSSHLRISMVRRLSSRGRWNCLWRGHHLRLITANQVHKILQAPRLTALCLPRPRVRLTRKAATTHFVICWFSLTPSIPPTQRWITTETIRVVHDLAFIRCGSTRYGVMERKSMLLLHDQPLWVPYLHVVSSALLAHSKNQWLLWNSGGPVCLR